FEVLTKELPGVVVVSSITLDDDQFATGSGCGHVQQPVLLPVQEPSLLGSKLIPIIRAGKQWSFPPVPWSAVDGRVAANLVAAAVNVQTDRVIELSGSTGQENDRCLQALGPVQIHHADGRGIVRTSGQAIELAVVVEQISQ